MDAYEFVTNIFHFGSLLHPIPRSAARLTILCHSVNILVLINWHQDQISCTPLRLIFIKFLPNRMLIATSENLCK